MKGDERDRPGVPPSPNTRTAVAVMSRALSLRLAEKPVSKLPVVMVGVALVGAVAAAGAAALLAAAALPADPPPLLPDAVFTALRRF